MAIQAHLVELERKHKVLENELHEALVHLSTDDLQIVELKRRKLMVKDEIERSETYRKRNAALVDSTSRQQPCFATRARIALPAMVGVLRQLTVCLRRRNSCRSRM